MDELLKPFTLRGTEQVRRYLEENSDLIPILAEAPNRVATVFGSEVPLALEVSVDAEDYRPEPELWLMIGCRDTADTALDKLRQLDRSWTVSLDRAIRSRIRTDVEFI